MVTCPQDSAYAGVLTIITTGVDAGEDASVDVCTNTPPFAMIDYIGGTPDANGTWFDSNSNEVDDIFNPATQSGGNYFYIVSAAGCGSDLFHPNHNDRKRTECRDKCRFGPLFQWRCRRYAGHS